MGPRPAPPGFLWGTAISAHQSEGNNTNSDTWLLENLEPTVYAERSGDACDSYHRFRDDIALNAALEQMPTGMTRPGIHTGPRV